jgi:Starch-binding associating with outer membrane
MKLQSIKILAVGMILMVFASCEKDLLKTNTDPNAVSVDQFDPNNILTAAQLYYTGSTDNAIEVEETEIMGAGCFIQHFASTSGYFFGDKYLLSLGGFGSFFDHAYNSTIKNIVDLVTTTTGKPQYANLHQIARIMKVLAFEKITDVYGDVPYFNAGLAYHSSIYFPAYDKQQDIYADMIKEVTEAVDSLDDNADLPKGDVFYSASSDQIGSWRRFGNTLLLRIGMRLTKVDPTTAQAIVSQVQGQTMQSNDDNAIVQHGTNDPLTISRIYRGIGEDGSVQLSWQMSEPFIHLLDSTGDPRLPLLSFLWDPAYSPGNDDPYNPNGSSDPADQLGMPNGYDGGSTAHGIINAPNWPGDITLYSRPSPLVFNPTAPTLVLTYAESELLLADAIARWGVGTGTAEEHYNNGVRAAMEELSVYGSTDGIDGTVDEGDIDDFLAANKYDASKGLEMINTQFWVATFLNEYEAWANYRRTGFPALTPVASYPGSQSPGAIPRRMQYSTTDKQINPENYNTAVQNLPGGDKITSRIWWDAAN